MRGAFGRLLTTDYADPSEVFNDIDEVRAGLDELDPAEAASMEAKCSRAELEVHCRFTPLPLVYSLS
jgi:hypothetical protein